MYEGSVSRTLGSVEASVCFWFFLLHLLFVPLLLLLLLLLNKAALTTKSGYYAYSTYSTYAFASVMLGGQVPRSRENKKEVGVTRDRK
ncbi:hypothetical protein F4825DRAFT_422672 [Nemania diffusa]|nr:hypothetical protein F4825DRAFT_422672 [Nemania diffusa]